MNEVTIPTVFNGENTLCTTSSVSDLERGDMDSEKFIGSHSVKSKISR